MVEQKLDLCPQENARTDIMCTTGLHVLIKREDVTINIAIDISPVDHKFNVFINNEPQRNIKYVSTSNKSKKRSYNPQKVINYSNKKL